MRTWTMVFLAIAYIAAVVTMGSLAASASGFVQILFVVAIIVAPLVVVIKLVHAAYA